MALPLGRFECLDLAGGRRTRVRDSRFQTFDSELRKTRASDDVDANANYVSVLVDQGPRAARARDGLVGEGASVESDLW